MATNDIKQALARPFLVTMTLSPPRKRQASRRIGRARNDEDQGEAAGLLCGLIRALRPASGWVREMLFVAAPPAPAAPFGGATSAIGAGKQGGPCLGP